MKAQHLRFGKDLEMELKWEPMLPLQMYLLTSGGERGIRTLDTVTRVTP